MDSAYRMNTNAHREEEKGKVGTLRGGNSSILTKEGHVLGKCARQTLLRYKGIEIEDPHTNKQIMFDLGIVNEEVWYNKLSKVWPGTILREEEVSTKWTTSSGINVTGRPDIVLCSADSTPLLGLELKAVCSLWTARDVLFEGKPKWDHLVQAAHYSMELDIPFRLCYTSYVNYAVPAWAARHFPVEGGHGSELIEYNDKGKPKHVGPFYVVYELEWDDEGHLIYSLEDGDTPPVAIPEINRENIQRYYELINQMEEDKQLGPRPLTLKGDGSRANYSACDYCPLIEVCNTHEGDYDKWMKAVEEISREVK